jgi:hypothetical protein
MTFNEWWDSTGRSDAFHHRDVALEAWNAARSDMQRRLDSGVTNVIVSAWNKGGQPADIAAEIVVGIDALVASPKS